MLNEALSSLREGNWVTVVLVAIVLLSVLQGAFRGFSRSAGRLLGLLGSGLLTAASLAGALLSAALLSPLVKTWAEGRTAPAGELSGWQVVYYTALSSLTASPLLRFLLLTAVCSMAIRLLLALLRVPRPGRRFGAAPARRTLPGTLGGAGIGLCIGAVRGAVVVALLYVAAGLGPDTGFARYVESSPVYRQSADALIEPLGGRAVRQGLPVLTRTFASEMDGILRRKYDLVDRDISASIAEAAGQIAGKGKNDEEKARLLYDWVGSRIAYDHAKAENYEKNGIWKEQTPQDTFDTREGVCIDYARLYAVMARSQNLQVRVVTGRGYDGRGGYGPHAWNEVYLAEQQRWVPLDPTWAQSGNWFDPQDFDKTHVQESVL
ncbi:transglutaminase domain-containing protein [Paenibacillus glufosinatiresistens]|uniref:transglutaminase domain-containing protein n=1 Tax=Paenibacillus glufosinatiresistens TaxID=3070657 RepID=UPI00286E2434|nr:transglutaminase-like domain-containing protein [Paenibacillus sp. YX.27]